MGIEAERATLFIVSGEAGAGDWPGWRVVIDDGGEGVAARALASGAALLLVDGRGDPAGGLAGVRALGGLAAATGGALLAVTDDGRALDALRAAGATHFLIAAAIPASCSRRSASPHARRRANRASDGGAASAPGWRRARRRRGSARVWPKAPPSAC
jgi:hypothetical protein